MNITAEGYEMQIMREIENMKKTRGNVAPNGEELRDTTANGRRLEQSSVLPRVQGKQA